MEGKMEQILVWVKECLLNIMALRKAQAEVTYWKEKVARLEAQLQEQKQSTTQKKTFEYINRVADKTLEALAGLPRIQEVEKFWSAMSKDQRENLAIPLGVEFGEGAAAIAAQDLEAIKKQREIHLKLSIYQDVLHKVTVLSLGNLEEVLETTDQMKKIAADKGGVADNAFWSQVNRAFVADAVSDLYSRMVKARGHDEPQVTQTLKGMLPEFVGRQEAHDEPEVVEIEILDEAPYRPKQNSNSHVNGAK
jgi:hypothetical protein